MWNKVERAIAPIFHYAARLDRQEWIILFCVALVLGYLCLKGFGSRTKY